MYANDTDIYISKHAKTDLVVLMSLAALPRRFICES